MEDTVLDQRILYYLAGVLALGIAAQWLAWRLRLPSILLLLGFGFAARWVADPDQLIGEKLLFPVVSLSVAVILFEGGLTLKFSELREAGGALSRLVTLGALISWALTAAAAWICLDFEPRMAVLLGAILIVTGPTVISPLLRHVRPVRRIGSIAKWEGIVIDPIGAVLAVLVFQAVLASGSTREAAGAAVWGFVATAVVGGLIGAVAAWLLIRLLKRFLIPDFLQGAFFLAAVLAVFALANHLQSESGLVTVTVLGILLANQKSVTIKHVIQFKENLQVLLISSLFIVLASRIQLSELLQLGWGGVAFLVVMLVLVRPASVMISMLGSELNWRERLFLSCLAPRGSVAAAISSIFALEVLLLSQAQAAAGGISEVEGALTQTMVDDAMRLVPVTFLVIVGTVAIYGLSAGPLARKLKLAIPNPQGVLFAGAEQWVITIAKAVQEEGFQVLLVDTNYDHIARARMAGLPTCCASVLSEYVQEELDLGGIGRLLAVTPNDEVNSLAALEFAHVFTRAEVYQLPPWDVGSSRRESASDHLRSRLLFGAEINHGRLALEFSAGAQVKKTKITSEFTYDDFRARYGESAILLFLVEESGALTVCTAEDGPTPEPGQTLICLVGK